MNNLSFQNTTFEIVDRNNQPWLRGFQIGSALGYRNPSSDIAKLFDRNADEFTPDMTAVVELDTAGGKQSVRIFSLRGAHLLGMLSHTQRAKAFRQWVLDVLEQQTGASANAVAPAAPFPSSVLLLDGKPVLTWTRLAECFGIDRSTLRGNQTLMPDKFMPGEHYVTLTGSALRDFVLANMESGEVSRRNCRALTVWTLEGACTDVPAGTSGAWSRITPGPRRAGSGWTQ